MKKNILILTCIIIGLIILDQLTKLIIVKTMEIGESIVIIKNIISITSHRNFGAAWGMFQGKIGFFIVITIISLAIFGWLCKDINFKTKKLYSIALGFLIAGTLGNFIDRIGGEGVVDFLEFTFIDFPVFNVADMCLTFGVIMLAIYILFIESKEKKQVEKNIE